MKHKFFYTFIFVLLFQKSHSQEQAIQQKTIAIKNVNVIQMTSPNKVLYNVTVIIKGPRIESINGSVANDAEIIDGKGKWLIPGLIDMHVHIPTDFSVGKKLATQPPDIQFNTQDLMTPFIANGVTTIFNLNANVESFSQRKEIEKGNAIGPRMAMAALINGGNGSERTANAPEHGRQAVRDARAEGYEFIKVYSQLNRETYMAIVDEAYKQGLKTVGHIPNDFQGKLEQAFVPHFGMVAHAEEFSKQAKDFSKQEARRFAMLAKKNGTWLSPTLITMVWIASQAHSLDSLKALPALQYIHSLLQNKWLTANSYNRNTTPERAAYFDKLVKFHFQMVRVFREAGVPMVAGTDAGTSGVIGGFSLHDELELLQQAGLTPEETLASATRLSAAWLGLDSEIGTIEAGKLADLILLDANPLDDAKNIRRISGVFVNGRWFDKTKLEALLYDLSQRNNASKEKFDWKKTIGK